MLCKFNYVLLLCPLYGQLWYAQRPRHDDHVISLSPLFNYVLSLCPQLWYAHRPPDDETARSRAYSQSDVQGDSAQETWKLNVGISSNGDIEVGEISLTEMDPEDIRVSEASRVYGGFTLSGVT